AARLRLAGRVLARAAAAPAAALAAAPVLDLLDELLKVRDGPHVRVVRRLELAGRILLVRRLLELLVHLAEVLLDALDQLGREVVAALRLRRRVLQRRGERGGEHERERDHRGPSLGGSG